MVFEKISELLAEQFSISLEDVKMETSFEEDLGADSLDIVELTMAIEEEFDLGEIGDDEITSLKTVGDLVRFIQNRLDD